MSIQEAKSLEIKSEMSKSFLKTVSAFANFGTGKIIFGLDDDDAGTVLGIQDPAQFMLDVENAINDSIKPLPRYTLEREMRDGLDIVVLQVFEGLDKPYLYRGKAYRRGNTSTVEVDKLELQRLILDGLNLSFDEVTSRNQDLTFNRLAQDLCEKLKIENVNKDILKTLQLYTDRNGYNNAAAAMADRNDFSGIDVVRFGKTEDEIFERKEFHGISALSQYDGALEVFSRYYQPERIDGIRRMKVDLIPEDAFREAVANALVHRLWDSRSSVRVFMYEDSIKIISPGGLPSEISETEYKEGKVSVLRNQIVGRVFSSLGYIERLGTGIRRIKRLYEGSLTQPTFEVTDNTIAVTLPIISEAENYEVIATADEKPILDALSSVQIKTRAEISNLTGYSKDKTIRLLNALVDKGLAITDGGGRSTGYLRR